MMDMEKHKKQCLDNLREGYKALASFPLPPRVLKRLKEIEHEQAKGERERSVNNGED